MREIDDGLGLSIGSSTEHGGTTWVGPMLFQFHTVIIHLLLRNWHPQIMKISIFEAQMICSDNLPWVNNSESQQDWILYSHHAKIDECIVK